VKFVSPCQSDLSSIKSVFIHGFQLHGYGLQIQPILYLQARHCSKIGDVAAKKQGLMRQADGSDLQIHCPNAQTRGPKLLKQPSGNFIERENRKLINSFDAVLEPLVSVNLLDPRFTPIDKRQPALSNLLDAYDGDENICPACLNTLLGIVGYRGIVGQLVVMICVKHNEQAAHFRLFSFALHSAPSRAASASSLWPFDAPMISCQPFRDWRFACSRVITRLCRSANCRSITFVLTFVRCPRRFNSASHDAAAFLLLRIPSLVPKS